MLGMFSKSLALGSMIALSVACSQQSESPKAHKVNVAASKLKDRTNAPARNNANAELSCEDIWTGFVAANPVGTSKSYKATTLTAYTGGEDLPAPETVIETSKDTVTASSDASVSITYEYTTTADPTPVEPQVQTIVKTEFLAQCNAPVVNAPANNAPAANAPAAAPEPTVEILEEGSAKVTVAAGEFDSDFVKAKITQTGEEAYVANVSEWYITGTDFLLKSVYEQVSTFDAITVTTTQTIELTELVTPAPAA